MGKLLIPENDLQELWELNGRVKAVLAWAESHAYIKNETLVSMLGGTLPEPAPKEGGAEKLNIELSSTEIGTPDIQTGGGSDGQN